MRLPTHMRLVTVTATAAIVASLTVLGDGPVASASLGVTTVDHARGFDSCGSSSDTTLWSRWFTYSPYFVNGFYLGGAWSTYESCYTPGSSWLNTLSNQGWDFLPIWDGKQSPCNYSHDVWSSNTSSAFSDGQNAATNAVSRMGTLGFPTGSVIFLDVEPFSDTTSCKDAAKAYISGFDYNAGFDGFKTGIYASECSPDIDWVWNAEYPPNNIWYANWSTGKETSDSNLQCMDATHWTSQHRVHQYAHNQSESYPTGTTAVYLDRDCVNAPVDDGSSRNPTVQC